MSEEKRGCLVPNKAVAAEAIAKSKHDRDLPYSRHRTWPNVLGVFGMLFLLFWPVVFRLGVIVAAYMVGMRGVLGGGETFWAQLVWRWCVGVPLLALSMIWAGYGVHEYVADWDFHDLLNNKTVRSIIIAAERAYIPILEWIMYAHIMVAPFGQGCLPKIRKYRGRGRVVSLALVRIGLFLFFTRGWDRWVALLAYFVSCTIFLHVLRFGDMFQHTYETVMLDPKTGTFRPIAKPPENINGEGENGKGENGEGEEIDLQRFKIDREMEQAETPPPPQPHAGPFLSLFFLFCFVFCVGFCAGVSATDDAVTRTRKVEHKGAWHHEMLADFLNLFLFGNFGYHNAHHDNTRDLPWQHKNSVHKDIYSEQTLPVPTLLKLWSRDRIARILATDYGTKPIDSLDGFRGSLSVSFLYPFG